MLPSLEDHLFGAPARIYSVSKRKPDGESEKGEIFMNRRGDDRIEMQLPCRLVFPKVWPGSLEGFTANLHRNGVLVACQMKPGRQLPAVGEAASVHIELPPSPNFPPKFMHCDTTLLRVDSLGESKFQFALQIRNVEFDDLSSADIKLMEFDPESSGYVM